VKKESWLLCQWRLLCKKGLGKGTTNILFGDTRSESTVVNCRQCKPGYDVNPFLTKRVNHPQGNHQMGTAGS
jgi:hypothetical protein